jgi:hypothetical protein
MKKRKKENKGEERREKLKIGLKTGRERRGENTWESKKK